MNRIPPRAVHNGVIGACVSRRGKALILPAVAALASALWAAPVRAAPPQQQATPPSGVHFLEPAGLDSAEIDALIQQLGSSIWSARQEASEKLVAFGPAALPALEEARRQTSDIQTHSDLELIEGQIAQNLAHTGRKIYLRLDSADASDAIGAMAQQAGIEVLAEERRLRGLTLEGEIEGLNWWPAIIRLCNGHDLDVRPSDSGLRITRATDGSMRNLAGPTSTDGPLLVLARGARYERNLAFDRAAVLKRDGSLIADEAQINRQTQFFYDFEAMLEPRFIIGSRQFSILLTGATDDAGNVLIATHPTADGNDLARGIADPAAGATADRDIAAGVIDADYSGGRLRFSAPLRYPSSPGTRLTVSGRLRGLAGAELYDARATAVDLAGGISWNVAGERINLRLEASSAAGRWALNIESARALDAEIADLLAVAFAGAELLDGGGERFRRGAMHNTTSDDGRFTCRLEFVGPAEETTLPRTLRCRLPKRALELDLPFAFENLPMP